MKQPKILIVDDKLENLVSLETLLYDVPAQTFRALSGNEALALTLDHDFALVLLDVQMPGMDGFEVAQLLRENSKTKHVPIVFISAVYSGDVFKIRGVESGAVDFIEKPIVPELLLGKVRLFLELYEYRQKQLDKSTNEIVALISDGIMIVDRNAKVLLANPAAQKMLASDPASLNGSQFNYPLNTGVLQEISFTDSSGEKIDAELNVAAIRWLDENAYLVSMRDTTARKKLEEDLFQARKMEAVGLLASGIAHNFNNNLSIILGNVELLQMKTRGQEELSTFLSNAKIAIFRARDLVQQVMTYSRKSEHDQVPTVLAQVVSETINLLDATLPSTVKLEQEISPEGKDVSILAEPSRIQEALLNFCTNAVDAMDSMGTIKLTLQTAELEAADIPAQLYCQPGSFAKLSIQDTGCGIPPEIIDKIFDPFFTTKGLTEGTGMGLATVKGIVEQHNGILKVESTPGQGSLFELYFPIVELAKSDIVESEQNYPAGNKRILLVDDNDLLVSLWGEMLTSFGYRVTVETSSVRALELIRDHPGNYDLLFTDETMPDLTGRALAQQVIQIREDLPIILCTGNSSVMQEEDVAAPGIKKILKKPLDLQELLNEVSRVLNATYGD